MKKCINLAINSFYIFLFMVPFSSFGNQAPIVQTINKRLNEDTKAVIILKGKDPEHKKLSYSISKLPQHGSVVLRGGNTALYKSEANYFGNDSFEYSASDGELTSTSATVNLLVKPVNDAPVAAPQQLTVNQGAAAKITLGATDIDSEAISFLISSKPKKGTLKLLKNTVTYTPKNPGFQGNDVFYFKAKDQQKKLSKAAAIRLTVSSNCPAQFEFNNGVCVASNANSNSIVALNDVILPAALINISVPDAPAGSGATQVEGPTVNSLSFADGQLHFISPPDSGNPYTLGFKLGGNTEKQYNLLFEPRIVSPVDNFSEGGDEGAAPSSQVSEDIKAKITGLTNEVILPGDFTALEFSLSDDAGVVAINPDNYELHLHANGFLSIKDLFVLSANRSAIQTANETSAKTLASLMRNGMNSIELSGEDSKGRYFAFEFSFAYATNSISGRIVNTSNQAVTPMPGSQISVKGLSTKVTLMATPLADGSFQLAHVPTDSYEINLLDPTGTYTGTVLFGISGANKSVDIDLLVNNIATQAAKSSATNAVSKPQVKDVLTTSRVSMVGGVEQSTVSAWPKRSPKLQKQSLATPQADETNFGSVTAASAAENQTIQAVKTVTIPQGTGSVSVDVRVLTDEYPGYTTNPGNPYNDSWHYNWSCAGFSDAKSDRVNISHSSIGVRNYKTVIDLSAATSQSAINCNIAAYTANIGDSAFTTQVDIVIRKPPSLSIKSFRHKSGLFKDKTNTYHMGLPVQTGTLGTRRKFTVELEYLPKDAEINNLKLELLYGQKQVPITEQQNFTKLQDGLLSAEITLPELPLAPESTVLAQMVATLTGNLNGSPVTTETKSLTFDTGADTFAALFETHNAYQTPPARRYDDRNNGEGSDGWGRFLMHDYLQTGLGKALVFNDISGEHAWQKQVNGQWKSLGIHKEHKAGLTVDARYLDENGQNATAMQGNGNGATILSTLQAAQQEVAGNTANKPNTTKIVKWIDQNRAFLEALSLDSTTTKIYVGVASWHQNALIKGKFPDGTKILRPGVLNPDNTPVFIEEWNKPQKVKPMAGNHEGHIHVGMD